MKINTDPIYVRRRRVAVAILVVVILVIVLCLGKLFGGGDKAAAESGAQSLASTTEETAAPKEVESPAPSESAAKKQGKKADPADSDLVRIQRITGELTPKSVVASSTGQVFAQNMMYTHTVSAFTADGALEKTISDSVELADFGIKGHAGTSRGAPVEMAFSPDGKTAWVSNYSMYGEGFLPEGRDACTGPEGASKSFVYKIDTKSLEIVDAVEVGTVPKYVAITHDGSTVLVTNWCSMDLSVIDTKTAKVTDTIPLGGDHPRGIAVAPDDKTAFVAIMGDDHTVAVDLTSGEVRDFAKSGEEPRHLLVSPDGEHLYITNNGEGTLSEVSTETGEVTREVRVGDEPRSMTISPDGEAIYVANYRSSTVSKVLTDDFEVTQSVQTDALPIGITYEPTKQRVWVACYGGSILVFDDSRTVLQ